MHLQTVQQPDQIRANHAAVVSKASGDHSRCLNSVVGSETVFWTQTQIFIIFNFVKNEEAECLVNWTHQFNNTPVNWYQKLTGVWLVNNQFIFETLSFCSFSGLQVPAVLRVGRQQTTSHVSVPDQQEGSWPIRELPLLISLHRYCCFD